MEGEGCRLGEVEEGGSRQGEVEGKWREKWKTSGGRRLPTWRSRRQVEGEGCRLGEVEEGGCRQGEVEGKWREKAADWEKWKTSGGRRLPTEEK